MPMTPITKSKDQIYQVDFSDGKAKASVGEDVVSQSTLRNTTLNFGANEGSVNKVSSAR